MAIALPNLEMKLLAKLEYALWADYSISLLPRKRNSPKTKILFEKHSQIL